MWHNISQLFKSITICIPKEVIQFRQRDKSDKQRHRGAILRLLPGPQGSSMKQECILHSNSNSEFEKNLKSGSKQEAELNYDLELKVLVE